MNVPSAPASGMPPSDGGVPANRTARPPLPAVIAAVIIVFLSLATFQRNMTWRDSAALWKDVVAKSPQKIRGYYALGVATFEAGNLREAAALYRSVLAHEPFLNSPQILSLLHNNLGAVYLQEGEIDNAIGEFRQVVRINPRHANAQYNLAIAYERRGNIDEAIAAYEAVLGLKPDSADALNNLGRLFFRKGEYGRAAEHFRKALAVKPDHAEAGYNLSLIPR